MAAHCGFILPSLDCRVPSSADAISFSLSIPHPLSTHNWERISNTNNLHCIWKHTQHRTPSSHVSTTLICNNEIWELLSPVARYSQTPLLSSPALALTNTSGVCELHGGLQTPPETLLCFHLHYITKHKYDSFRKVLICTRGKCIIWHIGVPFSWVSSCWILPNRPAADSVGSLLPPAGSVLIGGRA